MPKQNNLISASLSTGSLASKEITMIQRVTGFDLARALAIFGMAIVNFKIAMNAETGNPLLLSFAGAFGMDLP